MNSNLLLASAAGFYAVALGVAAVVRKRHSPAAWFFLAGMGIFSVEGMLASFGLRALDPEDAAGWLTSVLVAESFFPGVWLCFSLTYCRGNYREFLSEWRIPVVAAFLVPVGIAIGFNGDLVTVTQTAEPGREGALRLGDAAKGLNIVILLAMVLVLVNLEKTFRVAVGTTRWRVKYVFLGLAVILGVRIYTLSQALLFSGYIPVLASVESGALLIACALLTVAYLRNGFAELDLYPSRDILHRSVTVILAGGYLFIVGILAKIVGYLGGSRSFPAQAFVVLLGIVGLAVLLLSDRVRLNLQRFVSRHFRRPQHDFRKIWTLFSQQVSSVPDRAGLCEAASRLISENFNALSVTILLADDEERYLDVAASTRQAPALTGATERVRLEWPAIRAGLAGSAHPVRLDRADAAWAKALQEAVPSQFHRGIGPLCVPLMAADRIVGLTILADRVQEVPYTHEELDLLECIGDQVAAGLLNHQLTEELMRARELEAFQAMSTFFVHDMKNAASSLNLMLQNLPAHMDDPAFREDALRAVGKAVGRINFLTGRLNTFRQKLEVEPVETDLNQLVDDALEALKSDPNLEIVRHFQPLPKVAVDREQMRNVVTNLVLNARAAVGADGRVCVETRQDHGGVVLAVEDNGCGMSPEFLRDSLFRPFRTTKKEGLGIGMFQSKMIVEAHHGSIQVESAPNRGTTIRVSLPGAGN